MRQKVFTVVFHKTKPYNRDIQIQALKSRYPQFKVKRKDKTVIEFIGELHVKPELPVYTVSITYRGSASPIIRVLNPELVADPPHFYKENGSLCLFHPDNFNWTEDKLIAQNIISWTAAWIYFYEVWLQTGKWFGPESHHSSTKK